MVGLLQKARLSLRHAGVARTAQRAVQNLLPGWVLDFNSLVAMESDLTSGRSPPESGEWPHRWAIENDMKALTAGGLSEGEVRGFFAQGGRAALCVNDGRLVTYTWYLPDEYRMSDWLRVVLDRQVFSTATFGAHEFRGRGVHSQTRNFAYPELAALGYQSSVAFASSLNRSALRAG
jgi:hypothetical protein